MTICYHGQSINPASVFEQVMAGRFACISMIDPRYTKRAHEICSGVMLDNGAFSVHNSGKVLDIPGFWDWATPWLDCPTTWAIIPDIIGGDWKENANLATTTTPHELKRSPGKVAPVWHLHDPIDRLLAWCDLYPYRVCFGSSAEFWQVGSEPWHRRVSEAFDALTKRHAYTQIHMLRGLRTVRYGVYPFSSVDSTDVARNWHSTGRDPGHAKLMIEEWDSLQCPVRWSPAPQHDSLFEDDDVSNF